MTEYFLPRHVHFCYRGDALVFLDLRHDEYFLVNGDAATALRSLSMDRQLDGLKPDEVAIALKELLDDGLLTTNESAGRRIATTEIELAMERLIDLGDRPEAPTTLSHVWHFITACMIAAVRLRWNRLDDIATRIEQRKRRHASQQAVNMARARDLTATFQKLRSFFPVNYLCLYDSLALLEFLARYRIFPTWVFGIRLEPWAAHCWVQDGGFTFNEGVEEAANYTPVMTI